MLTFLAFLLTVTVSDGKFTAPPGVTVFMHGENGFPCIRAPSVVSTKNGTLVAFAMCRGYTGDGCKPTNDNNNNNIKDPSYGWLCSKISEDNGATWSDMMFPLGRDYTSRVGKSVYDTFNNAIIFQSFVYGGTPNQTIYQIISYDNGYTWTEPVDVGRLYLESIRSNVTIGPGNGLQIKSSGRILFIGHEGEYSWDNVWYSDDFGKTYNLSKTRLYHMNEATLVELRNGSIMANMRNKHYFNTSKCNAEINCRGISISNDNGTTWNIPYPDQQLISPVCEASLLSIDNNLYFSNPNSSSSRVNMTIKKSMDNGNTWNDGYLVYDGQTAYSCLTKINKKNYIGLLYETQAQNCDGPSCQIKFVTVPQ